MFRTNGSKNYKVLFVKGGKGQKGDYTFITVEDELRQNQKFTDKMKIHVWGENLEGTVIKGNYVKILGANGVGVEAQQDRTDANKWYRNLTIECGTGDIQPVEMNADGKPAETSGQPILSDLELPF